MRYAPTSASWCLVNVVPACAPGGGTTCSSVVVAGDPVISGGSKELTPGPVHFGPNHKLLPAPLGDAQCQFQEFTDNSYQAQIAVSDANCTEAKAFGIGAFQARGAPYNGDGFACTVTSAGVGPEWASTWVGTYYAYDCKSGAEQAAFNWGRHTIRTDFSPYTGSTRPMTSGVTMSSSTQGIKTVLHPVSDLEKSKAVYTALIGVPPQADAPYYVGYDAEGQHIGLVPRGGPQSMSSPVAYWHVADIEAKLAEVTAAGATVKEPVRDVGNGRLVATFTDPDGNVLGLLQDP